MRNKLIYVLIGFVSLLSLGSCSNDSEDGTFYMGEWKVCQYDFYGYQDNKWVLSESKQEQELESAIYLSILDGQIMKIVTSNETFFGTWTYDKNKKVLSVTYNKNGYTQQMVSPKLTNHKRIVLNMFYESVGTNYKRTYTFRKI